MGFRDMIRTPYNTSKLAKLLTLKLIGRSFFPDDADTSFRFSRFLWRSFFPKKLVRRTEEDNTEDSS